MQFLCCHCQPRGCVVQLDKSIPPPPQSSRTPKTSQVLSTVTTLGSRTGGHMLNHMSPYRTTDVGESDTTGSGPGGMTRRSDAMRFGKPVVQECGSA